MRFFVSLLCVLTLALTGCSSRYADHGNITQVTLSLSEQQQVARDIGNTLFTAFGAKGVFDFPHSTGNTFAATLASELRTRGFGVNEQDSPGYNTPLRYHVVALNPQQFYVRVTAGSQQFTRIWSTQGNILAPLAGQAVGQGGV